MSKLLRFYEPGNQYFLTIVTHKREPILLNSFPVLWKCLNKMLDKHKIELIAWVILPDHFHVIINPLGRVESFVHDFKLSFGVGYRIENDMSSGTIWQKRYWDHIIRNQEDLNKHIDYIHFNPVKHGLVDSPLDWKESSIQEYNKDGYYQDGWGEHKRLLFDGSFGE